MGCAPWSASPSRVSWTLRVVRTKSATPRSSSSFWMRCPNAVGVRATARAAARKRRVRAAASKQRSESIDGSIPASVAQPRELERWATPAPPGP